jgi:hypothetical protein
MSTRFASGGKRDLLRAFGDGHGRIGDAIRKLEMGLPALQQKHASGTDSPNRAPNRAPNCAR